MLNHLRNCESPQVNEAEFKREKKVKKAVDDLLSHLNLSSILVIAVNFQMRLD